jgi:glycosyltransferase involved in cell wall biosynthesis
MRIAFVSYEFPPDTGVGGIATYVRQIASLFSELKISVEVICASPTRTGTVLENQYLSITRIQCESTEQFRKLSPLVVAERHAARPFDLIEVPEYGAEGLYMKAKLPNVPLVTKLHTPRFLIKELNDYYYDKSPLRKLKNIVGLRYKRSKDPEYKAIKETDFIISPSRSLIKLVSERWNIDPSKIHLAPNPYFPSEHLQSITPTTGSENILYIGRLETRKGVYNLARAIPLVLQSFPNARFTFLGKDSRGPRREKSMLTVLKQIIGEGLANVSFLDFVPLTEVPSIIAKADICVFPSLWENFPNVCLEAMTAGKSIVASKNGGMVDMLQDNNGGVLVDPHEPADIANGIIQLLSNPTFQYEAGKRNRQKAVGYYGGDLTSELVQLYSGFISK